MTNLIIDPDFETGGAPVDKLDRLLLLQLGDGGVDVTRNDVAAVEQTDGHVLAFSRVALHQLVSGFKASCCDLFNGALLVESFLCRHDGRVRDQRKVDARVRNEVVLELAEVNVQSAFKPQRRCDGGDGLSDDAVQVGVSRAIHLHVLQADFVDRLVIDLKREICQSNLDQQNDFFSFESILDLSNSSFFSLLKLQKSFRSILFVFKHKSSEYSSLKRKDFFNGRQRAKSGIVRLLSW